MADALDPKNADKRTAARYINSGRLDEKAYEKHVKSLPDVADKAAPIETVMDEVDLDDEDEGDEAEED
jgi:hypothetical protein